jgi:hypothetical protein
MILPGRVQTAAALAWRFVAVLVAAAAAGLMLTTPAAQFGAAEGAPDPTTVPRSEEPAAEAAAPRNVDYPAIAAHPLFYPSRTPWVPPPPSEPPPVVAAPSTLITYNLVGVVVSGSMRSAMIRAAQANKTVTLSEGQELEGWTLKAITRERLYFSSGEATYEMTRRKPSEMQQ